jgi:hypothetical protein
MNCHPERSEGSAFCGEQQVLRFAQDDKSLRMTKLGEMLVAVLPIDDSASDELPYSYAGRH